MCLPEIAKNRCIGVGFCDASVPLKYLPGWHTGSWGYQGNVGNTSYGEGYTKYGPTVITGDIVGCCIDFQKRVAFYTKNGDLLDVAFENLVFKENIYPVVGLMSLGEHIHVNFGKESFLFDIMKYIARPSLF